MVVMMFQNPEFSKFAAALLCVNLCRLHLEFPQFVDILRLFL